MAISQRLNQSQTQSLTLTPQLREAIKLLELSTLEISTYVDQAIQENPLLSFEETDLESSETTSTEASENYEVGSSEQDPFETLTDTDYDNMWSHASQISSFSKSYYDQEDNFLERIPNKPLSLLEHLTTQLSMTCQDSVEKGIGFHLIHHLDEAGYLRIDLNELAENLACSKDQIEDVLIKLQQFDPIGVFARDLAECLKLQLQDQQKLSPRHDRVLMHLALWGEGKFDKLCRLTNTTREELMAVMKDLKTLNPKPALGFDVAPLVTLIPDVYIRHQKQTDAWHVQLNENSMPRLWIERRYKELSLPQAQGDQLKQYVQNHLHHAQWLIKSLEQRAQTITAVAEEIVRIQENFFRYGIHHLKPLILKDIAEPLGLHESTISRVTSHKYMATPRGTFEFKYFFSQGLSTGTDTEDVAAQAIKHHIRQLIDAEDTDKPYSDDHVVSILEGKGIILARRTVAKYREVLKIPSSYQRRNKFSLKG